MGSRMIFAKLNNSWSFRDPLLATYIDDEVRPLSYNHPRPMGQRAVACTGSVRIFRVSHLFSNPMLLSLASKMPCSYSGIIELDLCASGLLIETPIVTNSRKRKQKSGQSSF